MFDRNKKQKLSITMVRVAYQVHEYFIKFLNLLNALRINLGVEGFNYSSFELRANNTY